MRTTAARLLIVAICAALLPATASAQIIPPAVPANLEVPDGHQPYLILDAEGTQNYVCLLGPSGFSWTFFGPQATLFGADGQQAATHFLSANIVDGVARATWQDSDDTAKLWAAAVASSMDPAFVTPGSIPWLLLKVVGEELAQNGGGTFAGTAYIQRVLTAGGTPPMAGCKSAQDVGKKALVPYTTQYVFYR